MRLTVLTLFPDMIEQVVGSSITGRARDAGLFELETVQIRDFAVNRYGKVDDYCFGGGTGMLMMAEPVYRAWLSVQTGCFQTDDFHADSDQTGDPEASGELSGRKDPGCRTIHLSPRGTVFNQAHAGRLAGYSHLIFICGHYEGIDQRVLDEIVDEELSIGDYVLTGGELAACVIIDALLRLVPGVLPDEAAYTRESYMQDLLEYPQYTRPAVWHGQNVPDVLLSGHQYRIEQWQLMMSRLETLKRRPDLMQRQQLSQTEWLQLIQGLDDRDESQEKSEKTPEKTDLAGQTAADANSPCNDPAVLL